MDRRRAGPDHLLIALAASIYRVNSVTGQALFHFGDHLIAYMSQFCLCQSRFRWNDIALLAVIDGDQ